MLVGPNASAGDALVRYTTVLPRFLSAGVAPTCLSFGVSLTQNIGPAVDSVFFILIPLTGVQVQQAAVGIAVAVAPTERWTRIKLLRPAVPQWLIILLKLPENLPEHFKTCGRSGIKWHLDRLF